MIEKIESNQHSSIKNIIAVMSGKGGVGKSSVTSLIAVTLMEAGYKVGILDADITGPSIPKLFGMKTKPVMNEEDGIHPSVSARGIKVMSVNLLLDDETSPVIWRGPAVSNSVKQFYSEVNWGELDYLLIDLPPGTGDVPLTIMQSIPIDGAIIVSSPQDLVGLIVKKSIRMVQEMRIPILGLIENMSYLICDECQKHIKVFGHSKVPMIAKEMNLSLLAEIPLDPEFVELCDEGKIELYNSINFTFGRYFKERILNNIKGVRYDHSS